MDVVSLRALARLVLDGRAARVRGSLLGRYWALVLPLLEGGAFTLVFSLLLGLRAPGEYVPFVLVGVFAWRVFARGAAQGAASLTGHAELLRSYPVATATVASAAVAGTLLDAAVAAPLLVGATLLLTGAPTAAGLLVWLPLGLLLLLGAVLAAGLLLGAWSVLVRDVGLALGPVLGVAMFAVPVVYPAALLPEHVRGFILANPVAAGIECLRAGLLGSAPPPPGVVMAAGLVAAAGLGLALGVHARVGPRLREVV